MNTYRKTFDFFGSQYTNVFIQMMLTERISSDTVKNVLLNRIKAINTDGIALLLRNPKNYE